MKIFLPMVLLALSLPLPALGDDHRPGPPRVRPVAAPAAINVNTADAAALVELKGVGEKKARAIIAFRKAHGPFASLDDFEEVPGIGPALIDANRDRIRFR